MPQLTLDVEAGQLSAELKKRGITADTAFMRWSMTENAEPPMTSIAQAGKSLDWLADEPDLYSDFDLLERKA